jgi:molybdopterin-guanine dinucleotide biosynthesis protein A
MSHNSNNQADVVGAILAGGRSRRMGGGDKGLKPLGGKPMVAQVIERLAPQVTSLIINTNNDPKAYASFGLPVAADILGEFAGPLAGVLTVIRWAQENRPDARWVFTTACDIPFLPMDCVQTLSRAATSAHATYAGASSSSGAHYTTGLWSVESADDIAAFLARGERKVRSWVERQRHINVFFHENSKGCDPFFNINTPEDVVAAERMI